MILVKKMDNDKETFEKINLKEALNYSKEDLVFTTEDDEEEYDDYLEDLEEEKEDEIEDLEDEIETLEDKLDDLKDEYEDNDGDGNYLAKKIEYESKIEKLKAKKMILKNTKNKDIHLDFNPYFDIDPDARKIYEMLPFLGSEKIKYIAEEKIKGNDKFKKVKFATLLPFMKREDVNEIFKMALNDEKYVDELIAFAPFVSREVLDELCDDYCSNKYQYVDINKFYPFMSSRSISKLFDYFLTKE